MFALAMMGLLAVVALRTADDEGLAQAPSKLLLAITGSWAQLGVK